MNINLDGGEVAIIKALGFGSSPITGKELLQRCGSFVGAELVDVLQGLVQIGYVSTDAEGFSSFEDIEKASFNVNPSYSRDLREELDPNQKPKKSRRVRRE